MQLTIFDGPPGTIAPALVYDVSRLLAPDAVFVRVHAAEPLNYLAAVTVAAERPVYLTGSWLRTMAETVLNQPNPLSIHRHRVLERLALSRQVVRVVCLPPELPGGDPERQRLREGYAAAASYPTRLPTVIVRGNEPAIAVAGIIESMRLPANEGPGVGAWRPGKSILVVGDKPNLQHGQRYLGPFCAWAGGCSPWLSQQLEAGGIHERELYWVNAYDVYRQPTDARFLEALRPRAIVTLGETASDWLLGEGCPTWVYQRHHQAPHPQYWRRFQRGQPYPLIDVLQRILKPEEKAA